MQAINYIKQLLEKLLKSLPPSAGSAKSLSTLGLIFFFLAIYAYLSSFSSQHPSLTKTILVGLVIATIAAVTAYRANPDEDWVHGFFDSMIDLFLAVGIACAVAYVSSADPGSDISKFFSDEAQEVFGLAFLIFSLDQLAKSSAFLKKSTILTEKILGVVPIVESARSTVVNARYAGLAAEVLRLPDRWFRNQSDAGSDVDELMPEPVLAALTAIRAWIQAREMYADHDQLQRAAWSESMRIYYQEEVFDISRSEMATNVRNYAFIILGIISKMRAAEPRRNIVLLQVTPFAPKDFYNYPNGTKDNRFYHEAEFFGTYRRILARIAADPQVTPLRVFLAASSTASKVRSDQRLGWSIDPVEKLILDLGRYRLIPIPITFDRSQKIPRTVATGMPNTRTRIDRLPYDPSPANHPANRLPNQVSRFLWSPAYVDLRNATPTAFREASENVVDQVDGTRMDWLRRQNTHSEERNDDNAEQHRRFDRLKESTVGAWPDLFADAKQNCSEAWDRLLFAFKSAINIKPLEAEVDAWLHNDSTAGDLARRLDELDPSIGSRRQDVLNSLQILRRLRQEVAAYEGESRKGEGTISTDHLLEVVRLVQEADSQLQLLKHASYLPQPVTASTGIELGPAEDWFHRFMIREEAQSVGAIIEKGGALPLLDLLATDLGGIRRDSLRDYDPKLVGQAVRIFELPPDDTEADETQAPLLRGSISPEFLLVGFYNGPAGEWSFSSVEWACLVRAEISEPFHTCRISLRFNGPAHASEIEAYKNWASDVWRMSEGRTQAILGAALEEKKAAERPLPTRKRRQAR